MFIKDWKKELFTIPNFLSMFRLLLIPVYMTIYLNAKESKDYIIAGVILGLSCLTDMVDGKIARKFNMITTFGKFLDPLADKITQFTLIFCLCIRHPILRAVLVLFFAKELFQLIAGIMAAKRGYILKGALMSGKVCTTVLFVSLVTLVIFPALSEIAVSMIALLDAFFLLIAFADYFRTYAGKSSQFQPLDDEPNANV